MTCRLCSCARLPYLGFATYSYAAVMQIEFTESRVFSCVNDDSFGYGQCPVLGSQVIDSLREWPVCASSCEDKGVVVVQSV